MTSSQVSNIVSNTPPIETTAGSRSTPTQYSTNQDPGSRNQDHGLPSPMPGMVFPGPMIGVTANLSHMNSNGPAYEHKSFCNGSCENTCNGEVVKAAQSVFVESPISHRAYLTGIDTASIGQTTYGLQHDLVKTSIEQSIQSVLQPELAESRMEVSGKRSTGSKPGSPKKCFFLIQGKCNKGASCPYSHDIQEGIFVKPRTPPRTPPRSPTIDSDAGLRSGKNGKKSPPHSPPMPKPRPR